MRLFILSFPRRPFLYFMVYLSIFIAQVGSTELHVHYHSSDNFKYAKHVTT